MWPALRLVAWAVCCLYAGTVAVAWHANGHAWFLSSTGTLVPLDFSALYVAGLMALAGEAATAYRPDAFEATLAAFLETTSHVGLRWLNPPVLLLVLAPLATLPYVPALAVWLTATSAMFATAMRLALPRSGAVAVGFAAPPTISNVLNGQNGYLSAGLFGIGLALIDRRPMLGGALLGLLTYKPHLAAAIPVVFVVAGRRDSLMGFMIGAAATAALSATILGFDAWGAFIQSVGGTADRFLGASDERARMLTVYAALSTSGYPSLAIGLHVAVAATAILAAARLWRIDAPLAFRAPALIAACYLVTPYAFGHDAAILVVAAAFLGRAALSGNLRTPEVVLTIAAPILPGVGLFVGPTFLGPCAAILLLVLAFRGAMAMRQDADAGAGKART
jgi:hypothetical protein